MNPSECENVDEKSRISSKLEKNLEVIRRMEDGQTCPIVCRSMKLLPSTSSVLLKNADKIEQSVQHNTPACAMQVRYSRSKFYQKKNWRKYIKMCR